MIDILRPFDPKDQPEQKKFIHELVSDLEAVTMDLDARAETLERALQHIYDQRNCCKTLVENCKSLISPIISVPQDVLSIIFDFYIHNSARPPHTLIDMAPLTLSHVCAGWRTLLLNSPRCWASRGIRYYWIHYDQPLFDVFLERIKSHTFPVKIALAEIYHTESREAVANTVHRWRTLDLLQYDDDDNTSMADFGFPRQADALEMLDYRLVVYESDDTSTYLQPFEQCENLRDLRLTVFLDDTEEEEDGATARLIDISNTRFPWPQLKTLHLDVDYPKDDVLGILRACPWLEELHFKTPDNGQEASADWAPPQGDSPIAMTQLAKLDLSHHNGLLWFIFCPILEELALGSLACEPISAFLRSSHPPLRILHIKTLTADIANGRGEVDISRLYSSFPKIDALTFDPYECESLPTFLSPRISPTTPFILPSCRHFVLNIFETIKEVCADRYSAPILAFIGSRWRTAERYLESVTLVATGGSRLVAYSPRDEIRSTPLLKALGVYREEGLKVMVLACPTGGAYMMSILHYLTHISCSR